MLSDCFSEFSNPNIINSMTNDKVKSPTKIFDYSTNSKNLKKNKDNTKMCMLAKGLGDRSFTMNEESSYAI